jgi:hypothetical protein
MAGDWSRSLLGSEKGVEQEDRRRKGKARSCPKRNVHDATNVQSKSFSQARFTTCAIALSEVLSSSQLLPLRGKFSSLENAVLQFWNEILIQAVVLTPGSHWTSQRAS